jgi:predicted SAM-dependent methyltransferase
MTKLRYLNVGCGSKFHKDWVNVDMVSYSPYVQKCNLVKGIPFSDNEFEVVYHSQVLEHIPKDKAEGFIRECFRVLEPGGIIRIVVPNLEDIVDEYRKHLNQCLENPTAESEANYDWNLIELYDQVVRNESGGEMKHILAQPVIINEKYVLERTGYVGLNTRNNQIMSVKDKINKVIGSREVQLKLFGMLRKKIRNLFSSNNTKIGSFRLGGEIHMWMYDRYSLSRLLNRVGFVNIKIKSAFDSDIPNWNQYQLDVKNGVIYDPVSLFMEAQKPS